MGIRLNRNKSQDFLTPGILIVVWVALMAGMILARVLNEML